MLRCLAFMALVGILGLLNACSWGKPKGDAAPSYRLDPNKLKDAVPRPEPFRRYGNKSPYTVFGKQYHILPSAEGYVATGMASWYGTKFHGNLTSNGERYDINAMTAAHKTLPIPCYARITNLENGKTTVVRINDRGPFHGDRIIDLSYAAATKLGYVDKGVAKIKIETITFAPKLTQSSHYYLQVAAVSRKPSAKLLKQKLLGYTDYPVTIKKTERLYRVKVGPVPFAKVPLTQQKLKAKGYKTLVITHPKNN